MHIGPWVCAVVLVGCQVFDPALLDESASFAATSDRDGGPSSPTAPSSDGCTDATELCNDRDDDCNGEVDEGADDACRLAHAIGGCASGGTCVIAECERGYLDCNGRSADGCEQRTSELKCGMCGTACADDGGLLLPDAGGVAVGGARDAGPGDIDEVDPSNGPDASQPPETDPECVASAETCNQKDDDCDDRVDEGSGDCAVAACVATMPSYRGAGCDRCVCQRCAMHVQQCQNHMDARWAMLCRDVTECYVMQSRAGECGSSGDCYGTGNGPCADQIRLASGGTSATDGSRVGSGCTVASPPSTACAAVSAYRSQCTREACADECAD